MTTTDTNPRPEMATFVQGSLDRLYEARMMCETAGVTSIGVTTAIAVLEQVQRDYEMAKREYAESIDFGGDDQPAGDDGWETWKAQMEREYDEEHGVPDGDLDDEIDWNATIANVQPGVNDLSEKPQPLFNWDRWYEYDNLTAGY